MLTGGLCMEFRQLGLCCFVGFGLFIFLNTISCAKLVAKEPTLDTNQNLPIILNEIQNLESRKDPKCYATASRLEDFMFGTPLQEEARFRKSDLQKELILKIWYSASQLALEHGKTKLQREVLNVVTSKLMTYSVLDNGDFLVRLSNTRPLVFFKRDIEHYSSIAYSYRALLALQQELLLNPQPLITLEQESIEFFKTWLDIFTLTALYKSDQNARHLHQRNISRSIFENVWEQITEPARPWTLLSLLPSHDRSSSLPNNFSLIKSIIETKLKAYEAYNQISMPVFMRNLQVYFARFQWPSDKKESAELKVAFTESMIEFMKDLIMSSAVKAKNEKQAFIRADHVFETLQEFVPYEVNEYEDVIFFPNLASKDRIVLEAYDTDSFRDSGLHWRYLEGALNELQGQLTLEPDPFAAELLVEGVAQFGVLVLRATGWAAQGDNAKSLNAKHLEKGFAMVQQKINQNAKAPQPETLQSKLHSTVGTATLSSDKQFFKDVTAQSGIVFEHRSSNWLSRLIRSYLTKSENKGTLTIPPAFGGAGVATEDINSDGLVDVLLVGGFGNAMFMNMGDGKFKDVSSKLPIQVTRDDRAHGEPRQPIIADFDNDGLQDIMVTYVDDTHRIYRNRGNWIFEDMSKQANLGGIGLVAGPATVCDLNNDGLLDIYIGYFGNYLRGDLPNLSRRNMNALPNKLFFNQGKFNFKDVTKDSGTDHTGWTQALSHTDLDGDGFQDLIVGNDFGVNSYLRNLGNGKFTDVASLIGTDKPSFTMNVGIADLNADNMPDIYISNIVTMVKDEKYVLPSSETQMKFNPKKLARMRVIEANDLFISGPGQNGLPQYQHSDAIGRGFSSTGWSWDADFFDFDLDGDDDLYCLNGMNEYKVYSDTPYYTSVLDSVEKIVLPVAEREPNIFFVNEKGKLIQAAKESGTDLMGNSRSACYFDMENDGDLDIVLNNYHGPAVVYENQSEKSGNSWLKVKLIGNPQRKSNRDAIGARLIIRGPNGLQVWREIHGSEGYLSVHPRTQHFGLGKAKTVDLTIIWPNGEKQEIEALNANQRYEFKQS